jgi:hypothetical protein
MFLFSCPLSETRLVRVRSATVETEASKENMAKSLTRQPFDMPSQAVLELVEASDKIAWLSEARYSYETKLRELEHQFESRAADLLEEYLAVVLQIHK